MKKNRPPCGCPVVGSGLQFTGRSIPPEAGWDLTIGRSGQTRRRVAGNRLEQDKDHAAAAFTFDFHSVVSPARNQLAA